MRRVSISSGRTWPDELRLYHQLFNLAVKVVPLAISFGFIINIVSPVLMVKYSFSALG
jgi:hypothetical protein